MSPARRPSALLPVLLVLSWALPTFAVAGEPASSTQLEAPVPDEQKVRPPPSSTESEAAARVERKVRLLGQAGISSYDGGSWLGGGLTIQGLVHGPVWVSGGARIETRPEDQATSGAGIVAVPVHVGFRFQAELTDQLTIRGGGDLLVVLEGAEGGGGEARALRPAPGGQLLVGLSLPLGGPLALDLSMSVGAVRREMPSQVQGLPALVGPDPRFSLQFGLVMSLGSGPP